MCNGSIYDPGSSEILGVAEQWSRGEVKQWSRGAVEQWNIGTMWNSESDVIKEGFRIKG